MAKTDIIAAKGKQDVVVTRIFDSPHELVFKTYLDPDTVPDWWGPRFVTTTVDKMEARRPGKCADDITFKAQGQIIASTEKSDFMDSYRLLCGSKDQLREVKEQLISYKINSFASPD
jgi:hypothetical protein